MRPALYAFFTARGLPGWLLPDYVALVGLAGLVGALWVLELAKRDGADVRREATALALGYGAALLGGYVFEWIRATPAALAAGSWAPILHAGRAAYGGLLAGVGVPILYLRHHRVPLLPFLDRLTVVLGVAFAFVRTGCFLAGCDYGVPTSSPFGVRFPPGSLAAVDHASRGFVPRGAWSLPVHPTELYEVAVAVIATAAAWVWLRRGRRDGSAFATWIALYAVGRFLIETLRGDAGRGVYAGLSSAQYVSLGLLVVAFALVRRGRLVAAAAAFFALLVPARSVSAQEPRAADAPRSTAPTAPAQPVPGQVPAPGQQPTYPQPAPGQQPMYPQPAPGQQPMYPGQQPTYPGQQPMYPQPAPGQQPMYPQPYYGQPYAPYYMPAPPPRPPAKEPEPKLVTLRAVAAPSVTIARKEVPAGGVFEIAGMYHLQLSTHARFEIGLEGRIYGNTEADHYALGVPLLFVARAHRIEFVTEMAIFHNWIHFDSPYFQSNTTAWGMRFGLGLQGRLGESFILGGSPLTFDVVSSQSIGVITTWEPRVWFGVLL